MTEACRPSAEVPASDLTEAERLAIADRNSYQPTGPCPERVTHFWHLRCLLCGREAALPLSYLHAQDIAREGRRRAECSHRMSARKGPGWAQFSALSSEEAGALLELIGTPAVYPGSLREHVIRKLTRIAGVSVPRETEEPG